MPGENVRILPVKAGFVQCLPEKKESVEHCRFCVYSRYFLVGGKYVRSPALAYCLRHRATEEVNLRHVEAVKCADERGEGYRSMMNIIG